MDPTEDDATALLRLADRLDAAGRPFVALAAREAARSAQSGQALHVAALRRRAIELAVALDTSGLPAEAQSLFDEVIRRARGAADALPDRPFRAWLDAIAAQFPDDVRPL